MSKIFYDDYIDLSEVEKKIKKLVKDKGTRDELIELIDDIVHHRMIGCILDNLDKKHHKEFVSHLHERPHDEGILHYLQSRMAHDVKEFLAIEAHKLSGELLDIVQDEK